MNVLRIVAELVDVIMSIETGLTKDRLLPSPDRIVRICYWRLCSGSFWLLNKGWTSRGNGTNQISARNLIRLFHSWNWSWQVDWHSYSNAVRPYSDFPSPVSVQFPSESWYPLHSSISVLDHKMCSDHRPQLAVRSSWIILLCSIRKQFESKMLWESYLSCSMRSSVIFFQAVRVCER